MKRIALIGCSQKKLGKNCPSTKFAAKDIYLGRNYLKAKDKGVRRFECEEHYYILSGKYGLLDSNDEITYYDTYLGHFTVNEKKKWAENVIEQLERIFDLSNTEFVIFAGDSYSKYIKKHLNCITLKFNGRHITFEIKEQLQNGNKHAQ